MLLALATLELTENKVAPLELVLISRRVLQMFLVESDHVRHGGLENIYHSEIIRF